MRLNFVTEVWVLFVALEKNKVDIYIYFRPGQVNKRR